MNTQPSLSEELQRFGLSQADAQVYLELAGHGEMRIQEIARNTQLPRSSVYECLKSLSALGLIEKIIDQKFIRIRPYAISVLRHSLQEKLQKIEGQLGDLPRLEDSLTKFAHTHPAPTTSVRYYTGIMGARQLFWNTLRANTPVYVYSAYGRSAFVGKQYYKSFVRESQDLSIQEKVLINPTERALSFIRQDTGSSLARTKIANIRYLDESKVRIRGETFMYNNIYAQVYLDQTNIQGFEIESDAFAKMQRSIFDTLWNSTESITTLL